MRATAPKVRIEIASFIGPPWVQTKEERRFRHPLPDEAPKSADEPLRRSTLKHRLPAWVISPVFPQRYVHNRFVFNAEPIGGSHASNLAREVSCDANR